MDLVNLTIDGIKVSVPAGSTVLEAARSANIQIPYEHVRLIGELKEYDAEYGDKTVFKTAIGDFEELKKKIDNHNKTVALLLENAKDFEELYKSIIKNPIGFDSSVLQHFLLQVLSLLYLTCNQSSQSNHSLSLLHNYQLYMQVLQTM